MLVLPALCSYWIRARILGPDRAVFGSSQALALLPGLLGHYLRRAFFYRVLEAFHPTATIEFGTILSKVGARIGENVYVGPMSHLGLVDLERDVLIASGVQIPSGPMTHGFEDLSRPIREQPGILERVRVGAGSWIGSAAVVMADVGRDTVVATSAVVKDPLPDRVIAGGVPAKVIRPRELQDNPEIRSGPEASPA